MPECKLCKHPQRTDIETAIATNKRSMSSVAKELGNHKSTVSRHMKLHCSKKALAAAEANDLQEGLDVVKALTASHSRVLSIFDDALADSDRRAAIAALECEVKQLTLMGKLTGAFSDQPQVNFLLNPEFVRLKQVMIETLEPYSDARLALSEALDELANDE